MKTQDEIQDWLIQKLAYLLDASPAQISITEPLALYGLESVEAITIAGELSEWLGDELPSTLVWDYPTIAEIGEHLGGQTK